MQLTTISPQINGSRLWDSIQETAAFGSIDGIPGGMNRLSLSKTDKTVRDWFVKQAKDLGCNTHIDEMGNIFAIWNSSSEMNVNNLLPIGMGSHLDTQPLGELKYYSLMLNPSQWLTMLTGGRFDGVLGVLAALEVIRTLKENGIVLQHPIAAINWTNE